MAKLRKILFTFLLSVLLLAGLVYVLFRSRPVQLYLTQKAATYLSKELKTEVRIGGVDIEWFSKVVLEEVLIRDQQGDTLFAIGKVKAALDRIDNEKGEILLDYLGLEEAYVNFGIHKGEETQNHRFFFKYFEPKDTNKPAGKPFALKSKKVDLINCIFRNFNDNEPAPSYSKFNPFDFKLSNIYGNLRDFMILNDSIHFFSKNLGATEKSGWYVSNLRAMCNIHRNGMEFDSLYLTGCQSLVKGYLHFDYKGFSAFSDFNKKIVMDARLDGSIVTMQGLVPFGNGLRSMEQRFTINGKGHGPLENLRLKGMTISATPGDLYFQGDASLTGLPDWENCYTDISFRKLETSAEGIAQTFPQVQLPKELQSLGKVSYRGKMTGFIGDFATWGEMNTALGTLKTDVHIKLSDSTGKLRYTGNLFSASFNGAGFDYTKGILGTSSFQLSFNGSGSSADEFLMKTDARLNGLLLNGTPVNNISAKGTLDSRRFSGTVASADPGLAMNFSGYVDYGTETPGGNFTLQLGQFLPERYRMKGLGSALNGNFAVDFSGIHPDSIQGSVYASDFSWTRNGQTLSLPAISITSSAEKEREIILNSSCADATMKGQFSFATIAGSIDQFISRMVPAWSDGSSGNPTTDRFTLDLNLYNPDVLLHLFSPDLNLKPTGIKIAFDGIRNTAALETDNIHFAYKGLLIENGSLRGTKPENEPLRLILKSNNIRFDGKTYVNNLNFSGTLENGYSGFVITATDSAQQVKSTITGRLNIDSITYRLAVSQGHVTIEGRQWDLDTMGRITYSGGKWRFRYFNAVHGQQFIGLNGFVSENPNDSLTLRFEDFDLRELQPFMKDGSWHYSGQTWGIVELFDLTKSPTFTGVVGINQLAVNRDTLGNFIADVRQEAERGKYLIRAESHSGKLDGLNVSGNYYSTYNDSLDIAVKLPAGRAKVLNNFLTGVARIDSGYVNADLRVTGNLSKPVARGTVSIKRTGFVIPYLNTGFYIGDGLMFVDRDIINIKPFFLFDETRRNNAMISGSITHSNFSNFTLGVDLSNATNFKALKTTLRNNSLYYGTAIIDGNASFRGSLLKPDLVINVKSRAGTRLYLPISDEASSGPVSYISFKKKTAEDTALAGQTASAGGLNSMELNIEVTPEAEMQIIFDQRRGDIMKGRGSGNLSMTLDENGNFNLFGQYDIQGGEYLFTAFDVINKKFYLTKGGVIRWNGDPLGADINIKAEYRQKAVAGILLGYNPQAQQTGGTKKDDIYTTRIDVVSIMKLSGKLFSPEVSFDIDFPNLQGSLGSNVNDLSAALQRLRNDQDELSRQVFSLLAFGNFIQPGYVQNDATGFNTSAAVGTSVGELFTNQLTHILSQQFGKNVVLKFVTGGVQGDIKLANRINLSTTYNTTEGTFQNLNLEYNLREGRIKIKAYSRNTLNPTYNTNIQTQGIGVYYQKEFDRKIFRRRKKKGTTP